MDRTCCHYRTLSNLLLGVLAVPLVAPTMAAPAHAFEMLHASSDAKVGQSPDGTLTGEASGNGKWYVDGEHGSNRNDCKSPAHACRTIGHAIRLSAEGDTVFVAAAIYPEMLTIPHSLNLVGAGAATTIIDGGGLGSVILNGHQDVTISRVTMQNGGGDYGGGVGDGGNVYNCGYPRLASLTIRDSVLVGGHVRRGRGNYGYGGAIYNCPSSVLHISNTTISKNRAEVGGAICNGGLLTIENSTFSENSVRQHKAGAIANYGTALIDNSTFSRNSSGAAGYGGAIHNGGILFHAAGTLTISNSTFSGNEAKGGGGVFNFKGSSAVLQNSIVAHNAGGNCRGAITSNGYNLSSDDSCTFTGTGDLNDTAPMLGRLKDNGGPTPTMALLPGSPGIDSGNPGGCTNSRGHLLTTDQRGKPRPDREDAGGCDRGAYERQGD